MGFKPILHSANLPNTKGLETKKLQQTWETVIKVEAFKGEGTHTLYQAFN